MSGTSNAPLWGAGGGGRSCANSAASLGAVAPPMSTKKRKKDNETTEWLEKEHTNQLFLRVKMVAMNVTALNSKQAQPKHRPILGNFIYLLTFMAFIWGWMGDGIISAAMMYVPLNDDMKPLGYLWHEVIVSITPGMAGIGALCAGKASDVFGRKKVIVLSTIIFMLGALVCAIGFSKWVLLIGRILLGFSIGISSMIVPIYVGESSPKYIRGRLMMCFHLMKSFGLVASGVFEAGFSYIDPENFGWRLMVGFATLPSIIKFVGFLFLPESPRWLFEHKSREEAEEVLKKIYSGDAEWVQFELEEIQMAREQKKQEDTVYGSGNVLLRILATPSVRKALLVGCALQVFQQMSGINTIMYYTGAIIRSAGVKDNHLTIWISVITAAVNLCIALIPMLLIERLGRRILLLASIMGVFITLVLMGLAFLLIHIDTSAAIQNETIISDLNEFKFCKKFSNCDSCTTSEYCGFCVVKGAPDGYCLPTHKEHADKGSTVGFCEVNDTTGEMNTDNGTVYEWDDQMCQTSYTYLPILIMVLFLCAFAIGYAPLPWVLNAEFYPLWARGTCVSISTFCNWTFNLLISFTFLTLSVAVSKYGAFFVYAAFTAIALVLFYFVVPETKGLNLDEVQELFMTKQEKRRVVSSLKMKQLSSVGSDSAAVNSTSTAKPLEE